jgi:hypothetical protein
MRFFIFILTLILAYGSLNPSYSSYLTAIGGDSAVLTISKEVLTALKERDYDSFAEYIHPTGGVRFSPYAYVDTSTDIVLTKEKFLKMADSKEKIHWGDYDGSGDLIKMNIRAYFKKFVYDKDFLNAERTNLNEIHGRGNTPDNLETVYLNAPFTESYFSGFEEKYGGIDWRALKLVYVKHEGKYYLIAVIHSEWTI